jgi:hypothetical protein
MLASPNSANNPKYVLFTTLPYRVPAMFPTLRQHSREFKTRFDGKFDANSPAAGKKAGPMKPDTRSASTRAPGLWSRKLPGSETFPWQHCDRVSPLCDSGEQ